MATTWLENIRLTNKGKALLAKTTAGTAFTITKAVISAAYVAPEDQEALTVLPSEDLALYVQPVTINADGTARLIMKLTNDTVESSFVGHTIGCYAQDPDEGEILHFTMTDIEGDSIPAQKEAPNVSYDWSVDIGYGNASEVIVQLDPGTFITLETAEKLIFDHNSDPEAHGGLTGLLKGEIEDHIADVNIHVTAAEKAVWHDGATTAAQAAADLIQAAEEITTHNRRINNLTSDLAALTFDLAMSDLINTGGLQNVYADKIGGADDVVILSGQYADGKVLI